MVEINRDIDNRWAILALLVFEAIPMLVINSYILLNDVVWDVCGNDSNGKQRPGGYDWMPLTVLYFSFLFSALLAGTKVVRV